MRLYFILFISFLFFSSCKEYTPQEQFERFESQYTDGQYLKAKKTLNKLLSLDSTSVQLYNSRGLCNLKLKQYEEAIEDFSTSLDLEDENILAMTRRGEAKALNKDYLGAIEDLRQAIVAKGFKPISDSIFTYASQYPELHTDPLFFDIVYLRGRAYYSIFELYLALDDFTLCIEASLNASIDSKFDKIPECYYWRGHTLARMDETKRACVDLQIAADSGILQAVKDIEEICK